MLHDGSPEPKLPGAHGMTGRASTSEGVRALLCHILKNEMVPLKLDVPKLFSDLVATAGLMSFPIPPPGSIFVATIALFLYSNMLLLAPLIVATMCVQTPTSQVASEPVAAYSSPTWSLKIKLMAPSMFASVTRVVPWTKSKTTPVVALSILTYTSKVVAPPHFQGVRVMSPFSPSRTIPSGEHVAPSNEAEAVRVLPSVPSSTGISSLHAAKSQVWVPAMQEFWLVEPVTKEVVPSGHAVQTSAPCEDMYVPKGQLTQFGYPGPYFPGTHGIVGKAWISASFNALLCHILR
mmetsp:Transcript_19085/g.39299  ORF Transcript_19085/g.39299 Transcript_19085/m.39299 type:complete len:292 (-) Transcript_19085:1901-2776(-)